MAVKKAKKLSNKRRRIPVTTTGASESVEHHIPTSKISMANTSDSLSVLKSLTPLGTVTTSAASSLLTVKSSKAISCKKSSLATAQLIRRYHTLNKELSKCLARIESSKANDNSSSHGHSQNYSQQDTAADLARITEIRQEMDDLGGLDMYQKASTLGQSKQRGGDSSKWLVPILESHYLQLNKKPGLPLRLLDIGALSPYNYQKYSSWIQTTPIDLNPQDPLIAKMDFLEMPIPTDREHLFDVVCLSLVINFVGDPKQRGEILRRSTYFLMPGTGILYLVLPLPCIQNSRYMDHGLLVEMMQALGYTSLLKYHFARKLAYYAFKLDAAVAAPKNKHKAHRSSENVAHPLFPKKLRHDKPNRNNFSIILT